jgi:hypothetical protein
LTKGPVFDSSLDGRLTCELDEEGKCPGTISRPAGIAGNDCRVPTVPDITHGSVSAAEIVREGRCVMPTMARTEPPDDLVFPALDAPPPS